MSALATPALAETGLNTLLGALHLWQMRGNSTNFAFNVEGLSVAGDWVLIQNGDDLYLINPNGEKYTTALTDDTASGTVFLGPLRVDITNYNTGDDIAVGNGNRTIVFEVTVAGGYNKTVTAGNATIDISFGDQTMSTYGLEDTTILTTAAAQTKEATLKTVIGNYDALIGRLGATLISFEPTQESLAKQNEVLEKVIGTVQDANTVKVVQTTGQDMLRQEFAAQGFASSVQHVKTLENALSQSQ